MVETVTIDNEKLYREVFCVRQGHSMECVEETVALMGKVLASVYECKTTTPMNMLLENMEIEVFEKHLIDILKSKDCQCC